MSWPFGCQNAEPGDDVVEAEQVELGAEPAMIALLRLFPAPQELVELLLGRPGRAVDALEHRALLVAPPVRPGGAEQLERADLARARDVRPTAQVDERTLPVEGRAAAPAPLALGGGHEVVDNLDLERLVMLDEEGAGLGRRQLGQLERLVGRDALAHARLDRGEVVRGEGPRQQEVVVEAVLDGRADAQLGAREQVEDRLGHDVRRRMAHGAELARGAVVHQLVGGAALGRLQADLDRVVRIGCTDDGHAVLFLAHAVRLLENHETSRPSTGREVHSRGPTRLRRRSVAHSSSR